MYLSEDLRRPKAVQGLGATAFEHLRYFARSGGESLQTCKAVKGFVANAFNNIGFSNVLVIIGIPTSVRYLVIGISTSARYLNIGIPT